MDAKSTSEGKVVRALIENSGYTRAEIADALGVRINVIHNLCEGRTKLKGARLRAFAQKIGKPTEDVRLEVNAFQTPFTEPPSSRPLVTAEQKTRYLPDSVDTIKIRGKLVIIPKGQTPVPIYGGVPAGNPGRSYSDASDVEFIQISHVGPLWGKVVEGDSMEEEFLPRDIVVFEKIPPQKNQIVYATKDGEDAFKLLREDSEGKGWLHPLNSEKYEKFSAEGWQIHGVVRARIRYTGEIRDTREYPVSLKWRLPTSRG